MLLALQVLCEKPLAANAAEAAEVQQAALARGLLCREALHYREHPLAHRCATWRRVRGWAFLR